MTVAVCCKVLQCVAVRCSVFALILVGFQDEGWCTQKGVCS